MKAAEAAVHAGEAALKNAEAGLDYTLIRAPFDAVVLTRIADLGDIVTPIGAAANAKAAVVTIADMDFLQVEVDVSETSITTVRTGQPATSNWTPSRTCGSAVRFRHRAYRGPHQGHRSGQGPLCRQGPPDAAGHERQGFLSPAPARPRE